ncbi:glycosyltransferase family 2 protein [Pseudarthrobacter chlorophenolicus]|uniref:glycosyltransferase family 2 protein n=1 Tax=Pseudarthrobacter chlorophenolicus TaxID=85085 RepID=UPI0009E64885|nr:glycosyltransferase family A protein [Pseudarthrobacter chlorophenolicus]
MSTLQEASERVSQRIRVKPQRTRPHKPKVSVVIACYNYARYLPNAVQSCISQSDVDVEIIIVDDASTDDSFAVAELLREQHPNVSFIHRPENGGPVEAFNDGARVATGEFLVRLDADDLLTPGSLGRATLVAQAFPSVGLVYGHPLHFSDLPLPTPRVRPTAWTIWPGNEWLTDRCSSGKNVITSPEVLIRRSLLERYGYLSPLAHSHDMELWLRLSAFSDVAYIHGADQAWHREHARSLSATSVNDLVDFRERAAAFRILFEGPAGAHPDSTSLHALARRSLAKEALWKTRHELARGIQFSSLRTTWLDLSAAMDPAITGSPEWNRLHRPPAEWFLPPLLRPRAVALRLRGRIKSDLAWHRWHRTGVF